MQLIETNHMQTCYEDMLVEDQNHIFFQASRRQNSSNWVYFVSLSIFFSWKYAFLVFPIVIINFYVLLNISSLVMFSRSFAFFFFYLIQHNFLEVESPSGL